MCEEIKEFLCVALQTPFERLKQSYKVCIYIWYAFIIVSLSFIWV